MNNTEFKVRYYTFKNGYYYLNSIKIVSKSTYYRILHLWTDSTPDNVVVSRETSKYGYVKTLNLNVTFFE